MRWLFIFSFAFLCAATAGCPTGKLSADGDDDSSGSGSGGFDKGSCVEDFDCVPAATKCCECPTFAVPRDDPFYQACSGVQCPMPEPSTCASNYVARCVEDHCELKCAPLVCSNVCPTGFARDPGGCLTCTCAEPIPNGCLADSDCVENRADCCGCKLGGTDTAVLKRDRAAFDAMLACPPTPSCPNVDTCAANQIPRCIQSSCSLVDATLPVNACGRPDLPKCPPMFECTVNSSDPANMQGVGVCVEMR